MRYITYPLWMRVLLCMEPGSEICVWQISRKVDCSYSHGFNVCKVLVKLGLLEKVGKTGPGTKNKHTLTSSGERVKYHLLGVIGVVEVKK